MSFPFALLQLYSRSFRWNGREWQVCDLNEKDIPWCLVQGHDVMALNSS